MKIDMIIWGKNKPTNLPAWFHHGQTLEIKEPEIFWELVEELYNSGTNVMLAHDQKDSNSVLLAVDTKRFGQS